MRRMVTAGFALLSWLPTQSARKPTPAPVKGMASTVGLYVYPKNHQTSTQQLTDESQCYSNAKTQTGYDPNATTTAAKPSKTRRARTRPVAKGAMRGAVISGATGGDPLQPAHAGAPCWAASRKTPGKAADRARAKAGRRNQNCVAAIAGQLQTVHVGLPGRSRLFGKVGKQILE